jgi:hypothetical protein
MLWSLLLPSSSKSTGDKLVPERKRRCNEICEPERGNWQTLSTGWHTVRRRDEGKENQFPRRRNPMNGVKLTGPVVGGGGGVVCLRMTEA